jgi:hypothetical protein
MTTNPSNAEIRAALYYAVGVASEGGRQSFTMVVAGDNRSTPLLEVEGNSGYSIGTLQTDLGQRYQPTVPGGVNVPRDLIEATQAWAVAHAPQQAFPDREAMDAAIADFGRTGRKIEFDGFRDVDAASLARVNAFLGSEHGVAWVHARDAAQVERVMSEAIAPLQATPAYQAMSAEDQLQAAVIAGKLFNQSEVNGRRLIERMADGRIGTLPEVDQFVNSRMPSGQDFYQTGKDHARHGAEVIQALRDAPADTAMARVWTDLQSDPVRQPVLAARGQVGEGVDRSHQLALELFFDSSTGKAIVDAANQGKQWATGREPARGAGALVAGDSVAVWGREGPVHVYRHGEWSSHARDAVQRVADGEKRSLQLASGETLVAMDPAIASLRPDRTLRPGDKSDAVKDLQQQLADLGYTRANGQPLGVDGDFGAGTSHAVKAFQKDNALPVTGVADEVTRQAVDRAALEALRDLPPMPGQAPQRQAPSSNPAQRVEDALYAPLREQVYAMDRAMGRTPDEASDRVAAALCAECRANGLTRVDGVVLGQKGGSAQPGEYVFAYSGSSERPSDWVGVKTAEAVRTPVEQSLAKAETQQRQLAVEAQQMAQAQQPANDAAVRVMG